MFIFSCVRINNLAVSEMVIHCNAKRLFTHRFSSARMISEITDQLFDMQSHVLVSMDQLASLQNVHYLQKGV